MQKIHILFIVNFGKNKKRKKQSRFLKMQEKLSKIYRDLSKNNVYFFGKRLPVKVKKDILYECIVKKCVQWSEKIKEEIL